MSEYIQKYECYAYLVVNFPHNTYPIENANNILFNLMGLKENDWIKIKGLGDLEVRGVDVFDFNYTEGGKKGLYQEIAIRCSQEDTNFWRSFEYDEY